MGRKACTPFIRTWMSHIANQDDRFLTRKHLLCIITHGAAAFQRIFFTQKIFVTLFFVFQWNTKREIFRNVLVALFRAVTMAGDWSFQTSKKDTKVFCFLYYFFSADGNLLREDHMLKVNGMSSQLCTKRSFVKEEFWIWAPIIGVIVRLAQ